MNTATKGRPKKSQSRKPKFCPKLLMYFAAKGLGVVPTNVPIPPIVAA